MRWKELVKQILDNCDLNDEAKVLVNSRNKETGVITLNSKIAPVYCGMDYDGKYRLIVEEILLEKFREQKED